MLGKAELGVSRSTKETTLSTRVAFPALGLLKALHLSHCGTQIWLKAALKLSQRLASTKGWQTLL